MILLEKFNWDLAWKSPLWIPRFEPMTFWLVSSCQSITFLTGTCISLSLPLLLARTLGPGEPCWCHCYFRNQQHYPGNWFRSHLQGWTFLLQIILSTFEITVETSSLLFEATWPAPISTSCNFFLPFLSKNGPFNPIFPLSEDLRWFIRSRIQSWI